MVKITFVPEGSQPIRIKNVETETTIKTLQVEAFQQAYAEHVLKIEQENPEEPSTFSTKHKVGGRTFTITTFIGGGDPVTIALKN